MISNINIINKISITLKMPKGPITKTRISITLDSNLLESIKKECDKRTMKLSSYLEKLINIGVKNERK